MKAQQLKNSILQMAVQGKLVPQDPNDEPASELLKRIRAEKERLIKEKKIKPEKNPSVIFRGADNLPYEKVGKNDPVCIVDELPFDIPDSWAICRFSLIATMINGRAYKQNELLSAGKYPVLRVGNLFTNSSWYYSDLELDSDKYCEKDDLLYAWSASFGPFIWNGDKCIFHYHIWKVDYTSAVTKKYLYYLLLAETNRIKGQAHGVSMMHVTKEGMESRLVCIPPLAEQHRIVAKIEELLPHIEDYDRAEQKLDKLNTEFPEQLKKSILQWAIQGKLLPQNPDDEPASVLLERIRAEKARLVKDGKIKKDKHESVIFRRDNSHYEKLDGIDRCIDDEIPFEIPDSWGWVRLGSICEIARGGSPRPINQFLTDSADGINWIKIGDSDKGGKFINSTKEKIIPEGVSRSRLVHAGDFLLTNSMSFGRPYILNIDGCIHDGWLVLSGYQHCYNRDFLFYLLSSAFAYSQFCGVVSGAVVKNLNSDKVAGALFPLPPLPEQQRIVDKLEVLLNSTGKF